MFHLCSDDVSRALRVARALAVLASVVMTISAMAQAQVAQFAHECAVMDIAVITMIEDHGAARDLSADLLGEAGLAMLRARSTCYRGRVSEALALYQSILDLGAVASPPSVAVGLLPPNPASSGQTPAQGLKR